MRVLAIGLGWEQHGLLRRLARRGHQVFGASATEPCHNLPELVGLEFEETVAINPRDLASMVAYADHIAPNAVVTDQCDYSYFAWAILSELHGIPGPSVKAAQTATNKFRMRNAASRAGIRQPRYFQCATLEEATVSAQEIGYPVIVKPVDNRGSFGVSKVGDPTDLPAAVLDAITNSEGRLFLVETFVEGEQIIVEGYFDSAGRHHSIAMGRKTMRQLGQRQIADDIAFSSDLSGVEDQAILRHNNAVAEGLGYGFGLTSGEYRLDENGAPVLLEIANRGGGVSISSVIVPAVSGIDTTDHVIKMALSEDTAIPSVSAQRQSAYMHYLLYPPGRYSSVQGLEEARAAPGVQDLRWYGPTREGKIKPPRNDAERQGMLIAFGATVTDARAASAMAAEYIEVVYL